MPKGPKPGVGGFGKRFNPEKKQQRMMNLDEGEAQALLLAAQPQPKKKRKTAADDDGPVPLAELPADATAEAREAAAAKSGKTKAPPPPADPFAGALVADAGGGGGTYYQDQRRRWAYKTGRKGLALLQGMVGDAKPLLISLTESLREVDPALKSQGESIYAQKPNLGANGVTWSQENYAHLGLQLEYCRLKSFQRFTETFAALERAYNAGIFGALAAAGGGGPGAAPGSVPLRVAALGGGPGFELLAAKSFHDEVLRHAVPPLAAPELLSLDLAASWKGCAEGLGFGFNVWDVNDGGGLLRATNGWPRIDLAVISYVLYHYMSNDHCYDWMAGRLRDGTIGAIMIVSRFENLGAQIEGMRRRGARAVPLLTQPRFSARPTDHRQLVWVADNAPLAPPAADHRLRMIFPNVPHEDQKDPRDKSYDVDAPLAELPSADELRAAAAAAGHSVAADGAPPPPPPPPPPAAAVEDGKIVDATVPESLREALAAVSEADRALALAFFRQDFGGRAGAHEVTLSSDADGRVVLKLDFDAKSWKRVRKKAKAA